MASSTLKRKSSEMNHASRNDGARTPTDSPSRKKMRITRNQKQALIDNLQLEITERARKLRAQYALQANDLGARIERRVNRIPVSLRKANIGELLEKHSNMLRAQQQQTSPRKVTSPAKSSRNITTISVDHDKQSTAGPNARRVRKPSHEGVYSDKENVPAAGEPVDALNNPKKRGKAAAAGGASRVVSQEVRGNDYRILSPKSLNSRTYPQSPFRNSPEKPQQSGYLSKPMSPLKPSSPLRATASSASGVNGASNAKDSRSASQTSRPASRAAGGARAIRSPLPRPATRQRERRNSASSNASSGTTVVKPAKTGTGARKATNTSSTSNIAAKKTAVRNPAPSAPSKKPTTVAASKRAPTPAGEAPTTGRRTLRKRA